MPRRVLLATLGALALLAASGQTALAGGGGHVRVLLTTDPAAPTAGDTVAVLLRYTLDAAPPSATAYALAPGGTRSAEVRLERVDARTLRGTFFADRGGTWRVSVGVNGAQPLVLEVRGAPNVLAQVRAEAPAVPLALILVLALLPYALAVPIWVAVRPRTPAASYHMTRLELERKVA